ncbi:MAG: hypothetical protein ACOX4P_02480 [Anaerovoracaceae bacterium]|jgi:hypothetical protein
MKCNDSNEFFSKKIRLLKRCLFISEELLSSIDDWESLEYILSQRENVILELKELEESSDEKIKNSCTQSENKQIIQIISLLLDMDKDATRLIKENKDKLLHSMKTNLQEQRVVNYSPNPVSQKGIYLDHKQ